MEVFRSFQEILRDTRSVLTMGTFDGVHRGHQAVIAKLIADARVLGGRSVMLTFDPHPQTVINPEKAKGIRILTTVAEKIAIFEGLGIDALAIVPFDRSLMEKTGEMFVEEFLIGKIGLSKLLIGHDHAFGKNRSGNYESLLPMAQSRGFQIEKLPALSIAESIVNSTKIRERLQLGDLAFANDWLGRRYSVTGVVQKGDGRGRTIGVPTANIEPDHPQKLVPGNGVYACEIRINGDRYRAVTNIGFRPTFEQGKTMPVIEAHMLNFNGDLYGRTVTLEFIVKIRDEKKFSSIEALVDQIKSDIRSAQTQFFQ